MAKLMIWHLLECSLSLQFEDLMLAIKMSKKSVLNKDL